MSAQTTQLESISRGIRALAEAGDPATALQLSTPLLDAPAISPETLTRLIATRALILHDDGQYDPALEHALAAVEIGPYAPESQTRLLALAHDSKLRAQADTAWEQRSHRDGTEGPFISLAVSDGNDGEGAPRWLGFSSLALHVESPLIQVGNAGAPPIAGATDLRSELSPLATVGCLAASTVHVTEHPGTAKLAEALDTPSLLIQSDGVWLGERCVLAYEDGIRSLSPTLLSELLCEIHDAARELVAPAQAPEAPASETKSASGSA